MDAKCLLDAEVRAGIVPIASPPRHGDTVGQQNPLQWVQTGPLYWKINCFPLEKTTL